MAPLAGLIAHGGIAGAVAEALLAVGVAGILVAVWLRERRRGDEDDGPADLRDGE